MRISILFCAAALGLTAAAQLPETSRQGKVTVVQSDEITRIVHLRRSRRLRPTPKQEQRRKWSAAATPDKASACKSIREAIHATTNWRHSASNNGAGNCCPTWPPTSTSSRPTGFAASAISERGKTLRLAYSAFAVSVFLPRLALCARTSTFHTKSHSPCKTLKQSNN